MALTAEQQVFWDEFVAGQSDSTAPDGVVVAGCPGGPEIADQLIALYRSGVKTAGSGLVEDYESAGDPLPRPGDHWIALGGDGEPRLILRTERVEVHRFPDVPESIAIAEGEGDLSLDYWRSAHAARYAPHLAEWGLGDITDATVVTEFFTLVYP